jgi:polyisoprenoid-binding protein YceI
VGLLALIFAGATMAGANAGELRIEVDPTRTTIAFTLKATLHSVEGSARLDSGWLAIDPLTGTAEGEIVIDATSAETGHHKRDEKMHTEVLLSALHPRIVVRALRLEGELERTSASELTVVAEIELAGDRHELRLPLAVEVAADTFVARSEFTVPYVSWGLADPSTFVLRVAKEVVVIVEAAGNLHESGVPSPP